MRTKYWRPTLLFTWFLVTGAQAVWAQGDPSGQYFYQRGDVPTGYGDPNYAPAYTGMEQAGYPPGAHAWPNISPYGPALDQHYVKDGFWFNRIVSGQSRYFATIEALITRTGSPPRTLIGAEGVNTLTREVFEDDVQHNQQFFEKVVISGNDTPERDYVGTPDAVIFPTLNAGKLKQHIGAGGVRGTVGWWNPDGSGFSAQAYWQDQANSSYVLGSSDLILNLHTTNPSLPSNLTNENFETRVHPWFGLPLPGDDRDGDGLYGVVVPYDIFVEFRYYSNVYGGNLDWYFTPSFERDNFKVRGLAGARIMKVNEFFSFQGVDSGMGYTTEPDPLLTTGSGGGGGSATGTLNPNPAQITILTLDTEFDDPAPTLDNTRGLISSYLQSRTFGTFAGPEVGFRVDLGGERLKLWSQSKFGLMVYQSTRRLYGYNIGDHFNILTPSSDNPDDLPLDPEVNGVPQNPTRIAGIEGTTFFQEKTNTSVSPMFEQGIFASAPIFSYVPILKKLSVLEQAEFQAGYTITVLGSVYRPTNDIQWAQFPDFPTITDAKSKFYTSNWSVGVNWNY